MAHQPTPCVTAENRPEGEPPHKTELHHVAMRAEAVRLRARAVLARAQTVLAHSRRLRQENRLLIAFDRPAQRERAEAHRWREP